MSAIRKILFLMSDQHRPDVTGYEGDPVVRTPNLDWLASGGVQFRNAYTPSPICVPARQSILAGQLPSRCGCLGFGDDLTPGYMTYPRRLSQHGFETVVCGKLHLTGQDQMQGWTMRIGADNGINPNTIEGRVGPRKGKDAESWWPWAKEIRRAGIGRGPCHVRDEYNVLGAQNFIEEQFLSPFYDKAQRDQPLLLKVSLTLPHYPFLTDGKRFNYYLNRVQPYDNETFFDHPVFAQDWERVEIGRDVNKRDIRRATAAYYGMVEQLDGMFGTVLDSLRDAGEDLDEWLIVYTSDHGEMLGEHGIWMKTKFFEASARVPLIVRYPKGFHGGRTVRENVSLCDLFATFCDFAEVPVPENLDSRSLRGLLEGNSSGWDNEAISQLQDHVMIKRDALKYQYYGAEMPELLFDLEKDPRETRDFSTDPAYAEAMASFRIRRTALP